MSRFFSAPRLAPYRAVSGGSDPLSLKVYHWNARLSAALLYHFHILEVTLRNAVDEAVRHAIGANWLRDAAAVDVAGGRPVIFADHPGWRGGSPRENAVSNCAHKAIVDAKRLGGRRKETPQHNDLVASSGMWLWVELLGHRYDLSLWQGHISQKFSVKDRDQIFTEARQLVGIRNRIAHHDHIILEKDTNGEPRRIKRFLELLEYKNRIVRFVGCIDPLLGHEIGQRCDFEVVLDDYFKIAGIPLSSLVIARVVRKRVRENFFLFETAEGINAIGFPKDLGDLVWSKLLVGLEVICCIEKDSKGHRVREVYEIKNKRQGLSS